jgi:transposase
MTLCPRLSPPRSCGAYGGRRAGAIWPTSTISVATHVHELSAEERACPCCGVERQEVGADESWQIEYDPARFERIQHLRKKNACPKCERHGIGAQIQTAAKPESAIEKGLAGPGLLAYVLVARQSVRFY